jgi:antitoxin MazE
MRSALRRIGSSTGMIVPAAVLREAGLAVGQPLELVAENGRIVATPIETPLRAHWAEAAATLATPTDEEAEWAGVPLAGDDDLAW